jgi:hypothetical protein
MDDVMLASQHPKNTPIHHGRAARIEQVAEMN